MYIPLISEGIKAVSGFFERKQQRKLEETRGKITRIQTAQDQVAEWERIMAESTTTSWRDEWFSLLLSIPLVLCFIPDAVEYVQDGFKALESMPDYYQYWVGLAICSSFGVRMMKK